MLLSRQTSCASATIVVPSTAGRLRRDSPERKGAGWRLAVSGDGTTHLPGPVKVLGDKDPHTPHRAPGAWNRRFIPGREARRKPMRPFATHSDQWTGLPQQSEPSAGARSPTF